MHVHRYTRIITHIIFAYRRTSAPYVSMSATTVIYKLLLYIDLSVTYMHACKACDVWYVVATIQSTCMCCAARIRHRCSIDIDIYIIILWFFASNHGDARTF